MTRYVALLRAVNVGGTGRLAMADLRAMCADAGFTRIETYIASGNVVFDSTVAASKVKALLNARLAADLGKPIGVAVRTEAEIAAVLKACPFTDMAPKHTYAIFLDAPPPSDALEHAVGRADERLALGRREIFVHFPRGMGRSKLRIPATKYGTARNMTTVAMLAEMASKARGAS